MKIPTCDTSLTDAQWAFLKPMLPKPGQRGRPPTDRRRILDAILYVVKGGIPWRLLPASTPERDEAKTLLTGVLDCFTWLRRLWVEGGHSGPAFAQWVKGLHRKLAVEVVKRSDDMKGFLVLPRRRVVERTFGWLMRQRRLVRDYETSETSAEAWVYIAMIRIQLRRLA